MKNNRNKFTFNNNALRMFSFGMLLIILLALIWFTYDKHQSFIAYKEELSKTAVTKAIDAINTSVSNKKRLLKHFVVIHKNEIIELIKKPDDKINHDHLFYTLKRLVPDISAMNIYSKDEGLIIDDYEGAIGEVCENDLKEYFSTSIHKKRVHPNNVLYHYDEFTEIKFKNKTYLFFASYPLNEISNILNYSTPKGQNIILYNNKSNLIEVTKKGGRDKERFRVDFDLTKSERNLINAEVKIPKTYWSVISMDNRNDNESHLVSLISASFIIFSLVSIFVYVMQKSLNRNFIYLNSLNEELAIKNEEIVTLNSDLMNLTIVDPLTELYNRRYFNKRFEIEWNRAKRDKTHICIVMIDIDHFKKFNDKYGHVEGDSCLKEVSKLISSCFTRSNEFIARYGGEEFIGVVNAGTESCINVAKTIHERLEAAKIEHYKNETKFVTVSIGIAGMIPGIDSKSINMIKEADRALYQAKDSGRNKTEIFCD